MSHPDQDFSDTDYVAEELRKIHKPLYLCSLYFTEDRQAAARAILLFFEEVRNIPNTISEPMLGEMRTTWWRDLIEKGHIETAGAPLARELISVIEAHNLDKELFFNLLNGVTEDLYIQLYKDQKQLYRYFDSTSGSLFRLLSALNGQEMREISSSAGLLYGRTLHLYETAKHLQRHKIYWPEDLLDTHKSSAQMVLEQKITPELSALISNQIRLTEQDLMEINKLLGTVIEGQKPAFAPLSLIRPWVRAISRTKNILAEITPLSALGFQWHLWKCGKRGKF